MLVHSSALQLKTSGRTHGGNSPVFMPVFPAFVFFVFLRRRVCFRPNGRFKKIGLFLAAPEPFFKAQKTFFSAKNGVLRRVLRSPRGFWELIFHARLEQKGEFPPWQIFSSKTRRITAPNAPVAARAAQKTGFLALSTSRAKKKTPPRFQSSLKPQAGLAGLS